MDRRGQKRGVVYLNLSSTHTRTYVHAYMPRFLSTLGSHIFPANCCSTGSTKNSLSYLMTSARREENKAEAVLAANSRLFSFSVTHTVSYTPANSLLCFNACQRRLKRTEVHNNEENKQADENMGRKETRRGGNVDPDTHRAADKQES